MKQRTPSTEHLARVTAGFQKRNSTGNHCRLAWNSARTLSCFCVFPIWFHIIFLYIYCMWCVWVFCLHVHVCTAWVQGPWRSGEGIGSPRTGITDTVNHHVGAENWTLVLWKSTKCTKRWVLSPVTISYCSRLPPKMPAPSSLGTVALTHSTAMPLVFSQIKVSSHPLYTWF